MKTGLSLADVDALYAANSAHRVRLAEMTTIDVADVVGMHRHVRFYVADELWEKLTPVAQRTLLADEHHSVRSAAAISQRNAGAVDRQEC